VEFTLSSVVLETVTSTKSLFPNVTIVFNVTIDHFNSLHAKLRLYNSVYTIINETPCHQEASAV